MFTKVLTMEEICIFVLTVRKVCHLLAACTSTRIFMQVNTSVENVANVGEIAISWQYTSDVIQEINSLNVLFVANDL